MCGLDTVTLGFFLIWTVIAGWIILLGGAEWAEDRWLGWVILGLCFEIFPGAPATLVKVLVGVVWGSTVVLALFVC